MKINNNRLMKMEGLNFETEQDAINYLYAEICVLESHNKNYTRDQYARISTIKSILMCCDSDK